MTWCSPSIARRISNNPYHKASGGSYEYFEGMGLPDLISEVKKVDDNNVQFVLTRPEAPFLADLAMGLRLHPFERVCWTTCRVPARREKADLNPTGTGPFQLLQYQKDSRILYKAFPGYWGTKPKIDRPGLLHHPGRFRALCQAAEKRVPGDAVPEPGGTSRA
ncbi:ABC transporter substrate-binding protein [Klebsiella pneumoniae]|nr:ABC transporter substrate-binding protein [Klebsiella pneumoniae]